MGGTLDLYVSMWLHGHYGVPKEKRDPKISLLWNSSADRDGLKHVPFPELHSLLGATRVIVTIGDPVLAFMSLCRRRYIELQIAKLRKGLPKSKTQSWATGGRIGALQKDPTAGLAVMKNDHDGIGFLRFLHRWLGKRHPFDTLIVNMDHIALPEVQAAIASFAQLDPATHPTPAVKKRHSSSSSPGYAQLRNTAALRDAADLIESLPPVMYIPRAESCCPEMEAMENAWDISSNSSLSQRSRDWSNRQVYSQRLSRGLDALCNVQN